MSTPIFTARQQGFTFVELVAVLVIAGILAAVVLPRMTGGTSFDERGFRDRVVTALRYAQKSAVAARRTVCASFSAAPAGVSFRISDANGAANCAVGTALIGPEGNALALTAPSNVGFASLPADVVFDASGRPAAGTVISISGLPASLAITVEAETGYVH